MPRVLAMFVLMVLAVVAVGLMTQNRSGHRDTYRPKRRVWPRWSDNASRESDRGRQTDVIQIVDADELVGVRDALTSAELDLQRPIYRCGTCLAFYQAASVSALAESNRGRCVSCSGTDIGPVSVARRSRH